MANYKNKLLLIFLLISHFVLSQTQTQTIKVYNYDSNGIRSVLPEKIIEIKEDKVEVYETTYGIKNVTPTQIIQDNKLYSRIFSKTKLEWRYYSSYY